MLNYTLSHGIQSTMELLQECAKEVAAARPDEDQLVEQVMRLFRAEDVQGIAQLIQQQKIEKEFASELAQFVNQWQDRMIQFEQATIE